VRRLPLWLAVGIVGLALSHQVPAQPPEPAGRPDATRQQPREETTVADEIAALAHLHAAGRAASRRLVERGPSALPELHQALLAPTSTIEQRLQLATVLGEIGDPESVEPLIRLAEAYPRHLGIRQEVLAMLAELPPTPAAVAFVDRVLENTDESAVVQRKALAYYGQQRDERGARWVDRFVQRPEFDLRAAAVFLAARLGHPSAREWTEQLLAGEVVPPSSRYVVMLAYAEVASPEELELRTPEYMKKSGWEYDSALRLSRFRAAGREERPVLAGEMMGSRSVYEQKIAARWILAEQGAEPLAGFINPKAKPQTRAVARAQLRRAGYRVLERDGRAVLEREDPR
jgi:HEAT repeat protein